MHTVLHSFVVSPERAHQIQFQDMDADSENQLLFKPSDRIRVTWLPEAVIPSYLTSSTEQVNVDIEVFEEIRVRDWKELLELTQTAVPNSGSQEIVIPPQIRLQCQSELFVNNICPVAIRVSITMGTLLTTTGGETIDSPFLRTIGIWSGVAFIQSRAFSEPQFSTACDIWANPRGPSGASHNTPEEIWRRLPACPPLVTQARLDPKFELEEMESVLGSTSTMYPEQSMKFFHPNLMECYRQRTPDISSE